ncbi:MAG: hypothetical protein ACLUD0_06625 [Eubacterium ramulus]
MIGNLYNNTSKYAMPDTRVYVEVAKDGYEASFTMKNISEKLLNVDADALAERFVRGMNPAAPKEAVWDCLFQKC